MVSPSEPFVDDKGQPAFAPSAVLYLDLLGTSEASQDPAVMLDRLQRTKRAVDRARAMRPAPPAGIGTYWHMTWFSDNLGLHYAATGPWDGPAALGLLITDAGWIQMSLLLEGLFARGGVGFGEFYADPEFIHGPALVSAVEAEKNTTQPRVALDYEAVVVAYKGLVGDYGGGISAPWRTQLLTDGSDAVFVDYLATMHDYDAEEPQAWWDDLDRHRSLISGALKTITDEKVRMKYIWLAAYHDDFLQRYEYFLGPLVERLVIGCSEATAKFLPFGHEVEPPPESI